MAGRYPCCCDKWYCAPILVGGKKVSLADITVNYADVFNPSDPFFPNQWDVTVTISFATEHAGNFRLRWRKRVDSTVDVPIYDTHGWRCPSANQIFPPTPDVLGVTQLQAEQALGVNLSQASVLTSLMNYDATEPPYGSVNDIHREYMEINYSPSAPSEADFRSEWLSQGWPNSVGMWEGGGKRGAVVTMTGLGAFDDSIFTWHGTGWGLPSRAAGGWDSVFICRPHYLNVIPGPVLAQADVPTFPHEWGPVSPSRPAELRDLTITLANDASGGGEAQYLGEWEWGMRDGAWEHLTSFYSDSPTGPAFPWFKQDKDGTRTLSVKHTVKTMYEYFLSGFGDALSSTLASRSAQVVLTYAEIAALPGVKEYVISDDGIDFFVLEISDVIACLRGLPALELIDPGVDRKYVCMADGGAGVHGDTFTFSW